MDKLIDLVFNATLRPHRYGAEYLAYEDGAQDFFRVLRKIEKLPAFDLGWSMADISLWEHESEFLVAAEKDNEAIGHSDEMGYIDINDDASRKLETERVFYSFDYSWGEYDTRLKGTLRRFHPKHDMSADICIGLIEAVTTWKRPQHISIRPTLYLTEHHPLDRMRLGIGWMGWVPFEITPSDVPEADLVRTMNGGSLIMSIRIIRKKRLSVLRKLKSDLIF